MSSVQTRRPGVLLARWSGLVAGLGLVSLLLQADDVTTNLRYAGPLPGIALLVGVLVGELRVPAERGPARRALLETRRVPDYLPRSAQRVGLLLGAYALVAVGAGAADHLRQVLPHREVVYATCGFRDAYLPGPQYTGPGIAGVLAGLGVAALALRRTVSRPRPSGIDVAEDDAARRRAATAVVAGCGVLVAVPLAGTTLVTGSLLVAGCPVRLTVLGGWMLLAIAAAAAVEAARSLVVLFWPGSR